jgi:hypothetical protein
MPVVFVHGVNTRDTDSDYGVRLLVISRFIEAHFSGVALGGKPLATLAPTFPYWGDLATRFTWDMASLPSGEIDALGPGVDANLRPLVGVIADGLRDPAAAAGQPLLALARERALPDAVDLLTDQLMRQAPAADADRVAEFVVAARQYAEGHPQPAWMAGLTTDEQLLNLLMTEVNKQAGPAAGVNALGGGFGSIFGSIASAGTRIKQAAQSAAATVLDRTGDFASTKLLAWQRRPLNATLGRFFGDIFVYLDGRGSQGAPGAIPSRILAGIDAARAAAPAEPLVIIGHSLGGVITFDLLSHFRPELVVDLFVSVGSQVSHFEEMKRFKASDAAVGPPLRATTPANVRHWINVFDEVDIFSYACDKVFDRVHDFRYDTQTYTIKAHGAYFDQDRFYRRLRARIEQLS